jgi:hypothetical protein
MFSNVHCLVHQENVHARTLKATNVLRCCQRPLILLGKKERRRMYIEYWWESQKERDH